MSVIGLKVIDQFKLNLNEVLNVVKVIQYV